MEDITFFFLLSPSLPPSLSLMLFSNNSINLSSLLITHYVYFYFAMCIKIFMQVCLFSFILTMVNSPMFLAISILTILNYFYYNINTFFLEFLSVILSLQRPVLSKCFSKYSFLFKDVFESLELHKEREGQREISAI